MKRLWILVALAAAGPLGTPHPARAEVFKSQAECVVGKRVVDSRGQAGKVTRIDKNSSLCFVLLDATGKEGTYIFWMLHAEGASAETDDKLVKGVYECFAGLPVRYTNMDVVITGTTTYKTAGHAGKFHVEAASRKIVFESGPLQRYTSKLLAGPTIGLNTDGGTFFGTTCNLKKQ